MIIVIIRSSILNIHDFCISPSRVSCLLNHSRCEVNLCSDTISLVMNFPLCFTARRQFLNFKPHLFEDWVATTPEAGRDFSQFFSFVSPQHFAPCETFWARAQEKNTWPSQQQHPRGASWPLISRSTCSALAAQREPTARPPARPPSRQLVSKP